MSLENRTIAIFFLEFLALLIKNHRFLLKERKLAPAHVCHFATPPCSNGPARPGNLASFFCCYFLLACFCLGLLAAVRAPVCNHVAANKVSLPGRTNTCIHYTLVGDCVGNLSGNYAGPGSTDLDNMQASCSTVHSCTRGKHSKCHTNSVHATPAASSFVLNILGPYICLYTIIWGASERGP